MEETDCGSFFDHIDDLIDFPVEDMEAAGFPPVNNRQPITSIWSAQPETLPFSDDSTVFSNTHSSSDLSAELFVPYEDIVQLEWLSTFVEDSFSSESLTITKKIELPEDSNFNTPSPISVLLDSSSSSNSSCSGDKANLGPMMARCGRARSKRPRPTTFNPRSTFSLPETTANIDSSSDNFGESRYAIKMMKMKMKVRFKGPVEDRKESWQVRKCLHCEITKTPQWRAGPLGPKTLCNACGVRYKSGRLFPEYRPAASPTFMPSLHSNSHKKVAEMRSNVIMSTTTAPADDALIPHTACTPSACMIISEAFNIDHGKLTI